jgi:hypothetical protein
VSLALALAGLAAPLGACSSTTALVGLSVSTPDSTMPDVGETVHIVVRALYDDGSSLEVTDRATCRLSGTPPPGKIEGALFTAQAPGPTEVTCEHDGESAKMAITVLGDRTSTAKAVQSGEVAAGTRVVVETIVTAVDPEGDYHNYYGQDQGGGERSGLYFRDVRDPGAPAPAIGDRVRAVGVVAERKGRTVVNFDSLEITGTGTPIVDVVALADLDPAVWDGCLVAVIDVEVKTEVVDSYYWEVVAQSMPDGPAFLVDTLLFEIWPLVGDRFARVQGPLYVFEGTAGIAGAIQPRDQTDVVAEQP